ncbi:putative fumarate hydratase class I beta subunit [Methanocella paludicola SANAE]|uniref:Fumarate hydratase class I beta subunit n=1 Tax=Methanocella paludicola (strain DSM 17711 / JCM 13418 / NBRC 101707 / SANAE) TaxID=304371 RepID=D1YVV8_METPS|nr:FumA C-terminus/TtdB family hydratase beta subunit [Methanocella paludicola]BAI60580.1 putative fumarate hydratase class I beta subunit [Methanocella paludicola SANAE]
MEYHLTTPLSKEPLKALRAGDVVYITGEFITARDKAHARMAEYFKGHRQLPFKLEGAAIFHGAPIVKKEGEEWKIVAIGPTTSARMNDLEPAVIGHGAAAIIGKGGMGPDVLAALRDNGAVYLSMTGGTAVLGARMVKKVLGLIWEDLGMSEAVWLLEVENFGPLTVTMDAHMGDLYEAVRRRASENIKDMRL